MPKHIEPPRKNKPQRKPVTIDVPASRNTRSGMQLMPLIDWYALPDFPGQCNTEKRLKRAIRKSDGRLSGAFMPTWASVDAVSLPDGTHYKLNGHTRTMGWQRGLVELPPDGQVMVTIYRADNMDIARAIFRSFDNRQSVKGTPDNIYGDFNELGLEFQTSFIKEGFIANAVKMATGLKADITIWPALTQSLTLLDAIDPKRSLFEARIFAAALLTCTAHGENAITGFWSIYNQAKAIRPRGRISGPESLREHLAAYKASSIRGTAPDGIMCRFAMTLVDGTLAGNTYRRIPEGYPIAKLAMDMETASLSFADYCTRHRLPWHTPTKKENL